ncbi:phage portal protein [uncultured Robinsoniella sp.]|uniref:phage portal protein n=1 Tax=uncultured Robinsoniella sp. TaxID=904190 RepID=UPI00205E5523|nr:MAG TPA: portal protein [Caudoviricetes sp.]
MGFWNWIQGKMLGGKNIEVTADTIANYIDQEKMSRLVLEEFTIHAAINLIANCISKCEFKTFQSGKEFLGEESYKWNYEPNINQNSSQFIQELVTKLLYNNECLVVESNGQLIIAEIYGSQEFALKETIFSGVSRKGFTYNRSFNMSDVLYFKLNNKNIRQLLKNLCSGYNQILNEAVEKYEKAGGEKGTLHIDAVAQGKKYGDKGFEDVFEDLMNNRFKKFFNSRSAVLPLFDGFEYTKQAAEQSKKSTSEVKDITDLTEEILQTVARAFNIPVSLLKGDVSDVDKITKNFLTFCIDPICEMIATEINRKRYGKKLVQTGSYIKIDTTTIMHVDIFDIAEKIDKLIASGMYCIDELRKKLGDAELNTEESKKHFITKNYMDLSGLEGGDTG